MIKFGILVCDNCRKVLSNNEENLESNDQIETLESGYDKDGKLIGEGIHVCTERCKRGELYNRSKRARRIMHKFYYGEKKDQ